MDNDNMINETADKNSWIRDKVVALLQGHLATITHDNAVGLALDWGNILTTQLSFYEQGNGYPVHHPARQTLNHSTLWQI